MPPKSTLVNNYFRFFFFWKGNYNVDSFNVKARVVCNVKGNQRALF